MPGLVIIGYDGSPDAERAVDFAAARLDADAAVVVSVWKSGLAAAEMAPPLGAPVPTSPEEDARLEEQAGRTAADGAARAREAGLAAEPEVRRGAGVAGIAHELLDVAEERGADLVVVGRRGVGLVRSVVLGSVSDAAVRDGRCPVLVVPGPAD